MDLSPSPEARRLFSRMVARAGDESLIGLEESLILGVELVRAGDRAGVIEELRQAGWVDPHPDGGWLLLPLASSGHPVGSD